MEKIGKTISENKLQTQKLEMRKIAPTQQYLDL